jgi:hypothetical protein
MREIRGQDSHGSGHWQAPRGVDKDGNERKHNGVDLVNSYGFLEEAFCDGEVTKIWFPYSQAPCKDSWSDEKKTNHRRKRALRYVQITDIEGVDVRLFYISPIVTKGDKVKKGDTIGMSQDLTKIYPGMTQHCHLECKKGSDYIEPIEYLNIKLESNS